MSVSGVGSTTTLTVQALVDMRARLDDLQRQLGTGKKAETYAGVGLDRGLAVGLRAQLSAIGGFGDTITNVGVRLDLAQTALGRIADRYPDAHVAIAGRGELEDSLRTRARGLGLSARVHLLGLRSDVPALLAATDVFALPSLSEGLPLALLEAMFAARPIVASDVGEVRTALDDGRAGMLVEPGNSEQLAGALQWMLSRPREARLMGDLAARRAAADFDVASMVARYAYVYKDLL